MTEEIKAAFKRSGMTRFALARRANLHYAVVHGFFQPEGREITISTVERLADALELELRPKRKDG